LYNPLSYQYHSGRIVDERDYHYIIKNENVPKNRTGSIDEKHEGGQGDDQLLAASSNNNIDASNLVNVDCNNSSQEDTTRNGGADETVSCKQYLVHFPAGKTGGGKVDFYHWIFLEEHAINMGYCLIWAQRHRKRGEESSSFGKTAHGRLISI
jgi:hypothetical protein